METSALQREGGAGAGAVAAADGRGDAGPAPGAASVGAGATELPANTASPPADGETGGGGEGECGAAELGAVMSAEVPEAS